MREDSSEHSQSESISFSTLSTINQKNPPFEEFEMKFSEKPPKCSANRKSPIGVNELAQLPAWLFCTRYSDRPTAGIFFPQISQSIDLSKYCIFIDEISNKNMFIKL